MGIPQDHVDGFGDIDPVPGLIVIVVPDIPGDGNGVAGFVNGAVRNEIDLRPCVLPGGITAAPGDPVQQGQLSFFQFTDGESAADVISFRRLQILFGNGNDALFIGGIRFDPFLNVDFRACSAVAVLIEILIDRNGPVFDRFPVPGFCEDELDAVIPGHIEERMIGDPNQ